MKIEELNQLNLNKATTTLIKGVILDGIKADHIIVVPCICTNDTVENPCPCSDPVKLIIKKSNIVGAIKNLDVQTSEGNNLSEMRIEKSASVLLEQSHSVRADRLNFSLSQSRGPIINGESWEDILCQIFPETCGKNPPDNPWPSPSWPTFPYLTANWFSLGRQERVDSLSNSIIDFLKSIGGTGPYAPYEKDSMSYKKASDIRRRLLVEAFKIGWRIGSLIDEKYGDDITDAIDSVVDWIKNKF